MEGQPMNCRTYRKNLIDQWGRGDDPALDPELAAHAATCRACAHYGRQMFHAIAELQCLINVQAGPDFKEKVMREIMATAQGPQTRNTVQTYRSWKFVSIASLSIAMLVIAIMFAVRPTSLYAQAKRGLENASS